MIALLKNEYSGTDNDQFCGQNRDWPSDYAGSLLPWTNENFCQSQSPNIADPNTLKESDQLDFPHDLTGDSTSSEEYLIKLARPACDIPLHQYPIRFWDISNLKFDNPSAIEKYLSQNPEMAELLPTVCDEVSRRFSDAVSLTLSVYSDRESDDECLTLIVRQHHYPDNFFDVIDRFFDEWGSLYFSADLWLSVTTDFRTPE